ncbi:MAG: protein kinase [Vicinamibacterales bacterium]
MTTLSPGARVGPYEIMAALGEGGMGAVYRARDTQLDREVAVKVLLPVVADDPDRLARFSREAQVLASLNHPNVGAIYGLEELNGTKALILELVEGPTLAEIMDGSGLPLDEALGIARQIAKGLEAAHDQGIVHRDLKPANIKVRPDGTVKVLDFGLAKAMEPVAAPGHSATTSPTMTIHATMSGMILGTAAYMSPEQASGKTVDKRTDIWAFGVVLWEMLTGRQMFEGETVSHVLAAVLTKEPDVTAVSPRVQHLLARCLEKDPRKRLRDIGDAMSLVQDAVARTVDATPTKRWSLPLAWTVAGMLAMALGVVMWSRPAVSTDVAAAAPAIKFQIERSAVDPYNNAVLAFAISPDGRLLAHYTADSSGRAALSLRTLATGEARVVAGSAVQSPGAPIWSPDSRQIAFVTTLGAQVLDLPTGTTRELCTCRFRGGSWNRDGTLLLASAANRFEPIRRVSLQDRTLVDVTIVDVSKGEQDESPVFLPDGRRFLFTRATPGAGRSTYLGSIDGDEPRRMTDGARSLFVASAGGLGPHVLGIEAAGLVAQPIDPSTMAVTGEPQVIVAGAAGASMSNNGVLVTSARGTPPSMVPSWFDRTGAVRGRVGDPGAIQSVNLTSDGRTIAVGEVRGAGGAQLWLRDLAGITRRLSFGGDSAGSAPEWSPDGRRIIVSSLRDGVVNLYEGAADGTGSEARLLTADRDTYANDWSRDGRWVIYTMPKSGARLDLDLWVLPLDGRAERIPVPYLTTPAREAQAEFSPDGRFVAYTLTEGSEPEVYVQSFPNPSDGKWLISRGGGSEPHWSRDGKELFYFAGQTLMAVPITLLPTFSNGSPVRLFDAPVQPWFINDSDRSQVGPDGKFLLLVPSGSSTPPSLDVVVNWPMLLAR